MLKRILAVFLSAFFVLLSFGGCGGVKKGEKLTVVCSVFPLYDWARTITAGAEGVEVILLVKNGSDAHSYQPTAEDMIHIASCDLLLWVGGESEGWIGQALGKNPAEGRRSLCMQEIEGVTLREISDESQEHDHEGHDHADGTTDEHLWLSPNNALAMARAITEALAEAEGEQEALFRDNFSDYEKKLLVLDTKFSTLAAQYENGFLLFADRFPFVYLTEEYGIGYVAAFRGCSTDAEAGFDTILRLADAIDENSLHYIVVTETSDSSLAESVRRATKNKDQRIVVMHSLQALTLADAEKGVSYRTIMEENLEILKEVLDNKPIS